MDSKALLDYALFQLTPTRTRCDLVVFSGKKSEKVASGLVEPFVAHLKYAKDHFPKGGYSITLRPPPTPDDSSWFTKATFQRFVRFVSTPEILERITRIEREILQIDSSIQSSEIPYSDETGEESLSVADGNIKKPFNSSKSTSEEENHVAVPRENSRVRLQRLMDTRKALLQKEQAMAYARAVVAGYEIDTIDDLICFADTFGASRLREACTDFKELYKKKHSDDQWMDELAAVQACPVSDLSYMGTSGIMLAGDNFHGNGALSDSTATTTSSDRSKENNLPAPEQTPNVQQHMQWMNQIPPYMYNFQGPVPKMPAYYPYYPGHMGWAPPGGIVPSKNHKSSRKKEKSFEANGTDASEEDEQTESSELDLEADSYSDEEKDHDKKHSSKAKKHTKKNKTKSSKTVVIRNINYITSQKHNGEESEFSEDSSGDDDATIREGVDNAIASFEKHAHSKARKNRGKMGAHAQNRVNGYIEQDNENEIDSNTSEGVSKASNTAWESFQNLLLSHEDSTSNELRKHHPGDEQFVMKTGVSRKSNNTIDDSAFVIQREGANGDKARTVDFVNGEDMDRRPNTKKIVSEGENALFAEQFNGSKTFTLPDFSAEQTTIKNRKEEDWFIVNSSGNSETFANGENLSYERGFVQKETTKGTAVADDSFIVESRSAVDEHYMSHWRTDITIDADIDMPKPEKGSLTISGAVEPDDLCMVLVRESRESNASWAPEMDYEVEISFNEADKRSSITESNVHTLKDPAVNGKNTNSKKNAGPTTKKIGRDMSRGLSGSVGRSKLDSVSKSKKVLSPAMVQKTKLLKEEEERKRMEELKIQRQRGSPKGRLLVV